MTPSLPQVCLTPGHALRRCTDCNRGSGQVVRRALHSAHLPFGGSSPHPAPCSANRSSAGSADLGDAIRDATPGSHPFRPTAEGAAPRTIVPTVSAQWAGASQRGARPWNEPSDARRHRTDGRAAPAGGRRMMKVVLWLVGVALLAASSSCSASTSAAGSHELWDQIEAIPPGYIVAALALPDAARPSSQGSPTTGSCAPRIPARCVLADRHRLRRRRGDERLPPGEHRHVRDAVHVRRHHPRAARSAGSIAAYLVQKIFFTIAGTFVYLYMFLSVPGAVRRQLRQRDLHIRATTLIVGRVAVVLIVMLGAHLLAPGEEALGAGQAGRRDPRRSRGGT